VDLIDWALVMLWYEDVRYGMLNCDEEMRGLFVTL
jgi:hypothetical protein